MLRFGTTGSGIECCGKRGRGRGGLGGQKGESMKPARGGCNTRSVDCLIMAINISLEQIFL